MTLRYHQGQHQKEAANQNCLIMNESITQIIKLHPVPLCETSKTTPCCMSSVLLCRKTDYSVKSSCFNKNKDNC